MHITSMGGYLPIGMSAIDLQVKHSIEPGVACKKFVKKNLVLTLPGSERGTCSDRRSRETEETEKAEKTEETGETGEAVDKLSIY